MLIINYIISSQQHNWIEIWGAGTSQEELERAQKETLVRIRLSMK